MADTGEAGARLESNDASTEKPKSSILGQAPFKLDLRVSPRDAGGANAPGDVVRLKPVDRELLPDSEPEPLVATVVEAPAPTATQASVAVIESPPAAVAPTVPLPPPPPPAPAPLVETVRPGLPVTLPVVTGPHVARATIAPGQTLTLAPIAPRVDPATKPIDFASILGAAAPAKATRRRRRNPLGVLFKLALVAGLAVGGVYAVKKYVLAPKWQKDVKVLADGVSERRGLEWKEAVEVVVIPEGDYALRLASASLGVTTEQFPELASEWRAMGLAEGVVDLVAVGIAATPDQPAFYDPSDRKVYEVANLSPELSGIALSRALANALLDQHFGWSTAQTTGGPAIRLGVRALFDGDATAIQTQTTLDTLIGTTQVRQVSDQVQALRDHAATITSPVPPYAFALTGIAAGATVHLFPLGTSVVDRNSLLQMPVTSDASVFDAVRGRSSRPASFGAPTTSSAGMIYWYYALAGRIGSDAAWNAALTWNGDSTTVDKSLTSYCVRSTIATFDAAGQQTMLQALEQWAAAAPAEAHTTVAAAGDRIEVSSCDPGTAAQTRTNADIAPFGNALAELGAAAALVAAGIESTDAARACVVDGVRHGIVLPTESAAGLDRSIVHPAVDLTAPAAQMLLESCRGR